METTKVERPSLLALKELLTGMTGGKYQQYHNSGHDEIAGPCPICGGKDRFQCWVLDGIVHWSCRACPKPQDEAKLFEALGLAHDGYKVKVKARRVVPTVPTELMLVDVKIDYRDIERYHATGFDKALAYFEPFGIDVCTADDFMLGYVDYTNSLGVRIAGYTISSFYPLSNGKFLVKGVRVRKDEAVASPDMPKYYNLPTSVQRGFFNSAAVNTADHRYMARIVDALFITESEKCAMSITALTRRYHLSHIAAVSYQCEEAHDYYFDRMVSNAGRIIVIQDNEQDKHHNSGRTFNPGLDKALKVQGLVKTRPAYIIKPPQYKQISDLVQAVGPQGAMDWLSSEKACKDLF